MNGSQENASSISDGISSDITIAKIFLYSVILIWSLLGNILVIVAILKNSGLKTNFNYLIVNMAVSDLIIPCLALPMKIADANVRPYEWLVDGQLGSFLCKMCYFVADISTAVSAFSLVIIAANRFFAIAFPMRGRLSKTKTLRLISLTWILAVMLLSPYLYTYQIEDGYGWTMCLSTWSPAFDDAVSEAIFTVFVIAVVFALPCFAITIFYSLMLCKLRQNSNNMAYMLNQEQYKRRRQKDKNIFIMTVVIMLLYMFLWGPFFCTLIILTFFVHVNNDNEHSVQTVIVTVQYLGYLNSAVNPCVYFYFLKNLRQGAKKLFLKTSWRRSTTDSTVHITTFRSRVTSLRGRRTSMKTSEIS
ncbi:Neuropeptide FF receptor 2 [Exaiptasia diaphana]|nr:Neuropeptide FF receptor 2 [Exaiptasia diaphana]